MHFFSQTKCHLAPLYFKRRQTSQQPISSELSKSHRKKRGKNVWQLKKKPPVTHAAVHTPRPHLLKGCPCCKFFFVSWREAWLWHLEHMFWTDEQTKNCVWKCVLSGSQSPSPKPSRVFSWEAPGVLLGHGAWSDLFCRFFISGHAARSLLTSLRILNVILIGLFLFMCWTHTSYFYVNVLVCLVRKCWDETVQEELRCYLNMLLWFQWKCLTAVNWEDESVD